MAILTLEEIRKECEKILQQLSDPELISDYEKRGELSQKKSLLEKIREKSETLKELEDKITEDQAIVLSQEEPELVNLAQTELAELLTKRQELEKEIETLSKEIEKKLKEKNSYSSVIVEIRAGTGGEEAALFAADLFRMYIKYAAFQNWHQKILDSRPTELGGFKEIIFELSHGNVFSKMNFEGGVHRVQRIPTTEKSGRIHTSTVTVAVLPKPKKAEIKINPRDLKIDFYRASGPGGQYVNKRETAVRIIHLPSGIVVTSQTERNQLQNKENAMAILQARLLERKEREVTEKIGQKRKTQIGRAKRPEKVRTYNFPQNRVTDHRIKKSWKKLKEILEGELNLIVEALAKNLER